MMPTIRANERPTLKGVLRIQPAGSVNVIGGMLPHGTPNTLSNNASARWCPVRCRSRHSMYQNGQKYGIRKVAMIQKRRFKGVPTRRKSANLYCPAP
jgi:hypothetical protein